MPTFTLEQLCQKLDEPFEGDGTVLLKGVAEIANAKEGELSFVANPKYVSKITESRAAALIVPRDLETDFRPVIRAVNPYLTFTKALYLFHQDSRRISGGIHISSQVDSSVQLGTDVTVMPHAIVEKDVVLGDRVVIYPGAFIGTGAVIGSDVTLYPHVSIGSYCHVMDRAILHAGCRIGSTGAEAKAGSKPVTLHPDVELGANVVVAGFSDWPTVIGEGTKADNLVQVGAGSTIGPHCIIVAQVTLGDRITLGERVTVAGQVVVMDGVEIGARSRIGAKSVVMDKVPPDSDYWGYPAQPFGAEKRMKAALLRLPNMIEKLKTLEKDFLETD